MTVDFQQVRKQVTQLGENAQQREQKRKELFEQAWKLLHDQAEATKALRQKVFRIVEQYDPSLRCALPIVPVESANESLIARVPAPPVPPLATILAADGSQIVPDRHIEVAYGLINVGAIQMRLGQPDPPVTTIESHLYYDEHLYTRGGNMLTEAILALQRDLSERRTLARLARTASAPVISFTDGPIELWGAKDSDHAVDFQQSLEEYLSTLEELHALQVITAGYVDKPSANLVVRLLEVAAAAESDFPYIKDLHSLRGVSDIALYCALLAPGERSAVFAIQSKSAANYQDALALHFFYLNVGRPGYPHMARVEIPAWVGFNPALLNPLHAILISQCKIMSSRPYPYLLHRAHETAVVTLEEKDQVTQMIILELRRRGVEVGEISFKQSSKNLPSRKRYSR